MTTDSVDIRNRFPEAPEHWDDRTRTLIGDDASRRLRDSRILVVGLGGVGGYAAEMLIRSGVGNLTIMDADDVAPSNINRQLIASTSTIGQPKAILFADRFHDINPDAAINAIRDFLSPDSVDPLLDQGFDYVIDAIDTIAPKTTLIAQCLRRRIPIISSMGAGGRLDPSKVSYLDLWETRDDGLARAIRQRLKKLGMRRPLPVVASSEIPRASSIIPLEATPNKRSSLGTIAPVPATFGIFLAAAVIRSLISG